MRPYKIEWEGESWRDKKSCLVDLSEIASITDPEEAGVGTDIGCRFFIIFKAGGSMSIHTPIRMEWIDNPEDAFGKSRVYKYVNGEIECLPRLREVCEKLKTAWVAA